jgi:hypothetical protein
MFITLKRAGRVMGSAAFSLVTRLWTGYVELGSSASQAGQGQSVPLLFRSASRLRGGLAERR